MKRIVAVVGITWGALVLAAPGALAMGKKAPRPPVYLEFPEGFRWCAATAAHQIEGNNVDSDWWRWESENWAVRSGRATDSWNRVSEDIGMLKGINANTYRFSVEWAKIEPRRGQYDAAAIAHYREQIAALRAADIDPMVTLHHFTLPRWARDLGGFEWPGMPEAFAQFAALMATEFRGEVRDWITLNEPMVHLTLGYVGDYHPPNLRGETRGLEAILPPLRGMLHSHAAAYKALKKVAATQKRKIRVGIAHHLRVFDPKSGVNPLDRLGAGIFDHAFNWIIPEAIETGYLRWPKGFAAVVGMKLPKLNVHEVIAGLRGTQDFFGMNYYTRDYVQVDLAQSPDTWLITQKNPEKWEVYASGLHRLLLETHRRMPDLPIMITENGVADATPTDDAKRVLAIDQHLYAIHQAMRAGVPVTGYCHWSLMDNFEWSLGFEPRFGLYSVDYDNDFKRTPRASALHYGKIARDNEVWVEPFTLEGPR